MLHVASIGSNCVMEARMCRTFRHGGMTQTWKSRMIYFERTRGEATPQLARIVQASQVHFSFSQLHSKPRSSIIPKPPSSRPSHPSSIENQGALRLARRATDFTGSRSRMEPKQAKRNADLLFAALCGDLQLVRAAIQDGASLEAKNTDGKTALHSAAFFGCSEVAQCLIGLGANVNDLDRSAKTALVTAAGQGHLDIVRLLVEHGVAVNATDKHASHAVAKAASKGHLDVVQYLVEAGASANAKFLSMSALWNAAQYGHADIVRYLAEHGADVNAPNIVQSTALMEAAKRNYVQVVEFLVANGASINATNNQGETAFQLAARHGAPEARNVLARFVPALRSLSRTDSASSTATVSSTRLASVVGAVTPFEIELLPSTSLSHVGGDYRARWLDADVVIKLFIKEASPSSFDDEVRLWQRLRHPNVLKLYSACGASGLQFFVCEFASKGSLLDHVKSVEEEKATPWKFLYEAALGLLYLHERKIVHGDLRCSNILIGSDGIAKLANFMLSESTQMQSNPLAFVGPMRWQAPEHLFARKTPLSFASDVYSLGMCVLEAMTKQQPWGDEVDHNRVRNLKGGWQSGSDGHKRHVDLKGLDGSARALVWRMCCHDPAKRPNLNSVVYELEDMAKQEHARHSGVQPEIEPAGILKNYRRGEICCLWARLQGIMTRCSNPNQQHAFKELSAMYDLLLATTEGDAKIFPRFHETLEDFYQLVTMPATQVRVQQLSATCATAGSFYAVHRHIRELWRLFEEPPSVTEARWADQREHQIEFFVSEVSKTWVLLDELQSPDERDAFLAFLSAEIENRGSHYSSGQLEVMRNVYKEIASQTGSEEDTLVRTTPEWFIAWYELQRNKLSVIGEGGFGSVYLAKWLDSDVVVKEIFVGGSSAPGDTQSFVSLSDHPAAKTLVNENPAVKQKRAEALQMFRKEVDIWFKLRHPHVVELFGACHVGRPFFVCEYATNGTLPKYLRTHPDRIWAKLRDAALGVQYLHARGVVHSDLKGNNIVIGSDDKAKVTDFGLSSVTSQADETRGKVTAAWQWVAPECLPVKSGDPEEVVPRPTFESDVYALGMCTVEAMRAVDSIQNDKIVPYPWQDANNLVVKAFAKQGKLPPRPNMCTDAQWDLVERMCRFEPSERIKISTVIDELEKLVSEGEIVDRADVNHLSDRLGDTSVASNGIAESLDALRMHSSDECHAEGGALEHHNIVCGLLELLWVWLDRIHPTLAGHGLGSQVMSEFQALVGCARKETRELQESVSYTVGRFTEAALRALALHRRLDKFLDANPLSDVDSGALGDRRAKCEQILAGEASAS